MGGTVGHGDNQKILRRMEVIDLPEESVNPEISMILDMDALNCDWFGIVRLGDNFE